MRQDNIATLSQKLETLSHSGTTPLSELLIPLESYINSYPTKNLYKELAIIPARFHRQWIIASLRRHIRKLKNARECALRNDLPGYEKELRLAVLWFGQAKRMLEIVPFFVALGKNDDTSPLITQEHLEKGDVILSYKTRAYLRKAPISWLVRFASNSSVTHTMIACHDEGEPPTLLVSGDVTRGLGTLNPIPDSGEIWIVLRAKRVIPISEMNCAIDKWRNLAMERTKAKAMGKRDTWIFPEIKCQMASAIGLIYILFVRFGSSVSIQNPARKREGVFCSELIDIIFKEAGVLLSPRSEYDAVLSPVELLYSPMLEIKGIIAGRNDLDQVSAEIREQFTDDNEGVTLLYNDTPART